VVGCGCVVGWATPTITGPAIRCTERHKYPPQVAVTVKTIAVIPAYNEAPTIGDVIDGVAKYVDDVIVVDDGSTDETPAIARAHGASVIEHVFNTGVGGALRTGYRYAIRKGYDYIVQIDGDGQHDPDYVPELLAAIEDYDMVIGSRYLNESYKEYPLIRKLGIQFFTWLVNSLSNIQITDVTSGFRVYRVGMLADILHTSDKHWAVEQTFEAARQNYRFTEVSVTMPTRTHGTSQFDLETLLLYPTRMLNVILRVVIFR
jgi:glycosyltransferase involved in cell wall biosynthesis